MLFIFARVKSIPLTVAQGVGRAKQVSVNGGRREGDRITDYSFAHVSPDVISMSLNLPYPARPAGGHLFKFYALPLCAADARSIRTPFATTKIREITCAPL